MKSGKGGAMQNTPKRESKKEFSVFKNQIQSKGLTQQGSDPCTNKSLENDTALDKSNLKESMSTVLNNAAKIKDPDTSSFFDCVVLGAGLVGVVTALRLKNTGLRVAVIEAKAMIGGKLPFDGRTTAISYGSVKILKEVDLWEKCEKETHPIHAIKTFEAGTPFSLHFDQKGSGLNQNSKDPMGYMIDNRVLRETFQNALLEDHALTVMDGVTVQTFSQESACVKLTLSDEKILKTRLVIAAEGRHSPSRMHFGIRAQSKDYGHTAVVGLIHHEKPHHGTAFEVFHPSGPLALLPMPDLYDTAASSTRADEKQIEEKSVHIMHGDESIKKSTDGEKSAEKTETEPNFFHRSALVWSSSLNVKGMSDTDILRNVYHFFPYLGQLSLPTKDNKKESSSSHQTSQSYFAFYPLSYQKTSSLVGYRYALVGDAAHVMHPVAGQGVNLGWRDAKILCDSVIKAHTLGLDIGSKTLLDDYNRDRKRDQTALMCITHSLIKLFEIEPKGPLTQFIQMGRSYGLGLVNRIPPLKRFLMKKAMGL